MPDETPTPTVTKKRTRKATTPRIRKPKDPGILAIEAQAKAAKDAYRKSQSSEGVLERINKLVERLTPAHRQSLFYELSKTEAENATRRTAETGMAG